MNILLATDSFKDALSALEVCEAIGRGLQLAIPGVQLQYFPLADGGEGTAKILTYHSQGTWKTCTVNDPLFRPVQAGFGLSQDGSTAFLDMAQASGLPLLQLTERDPLRTTTFGTGELILEAIDAGAQEIILGIGGSATNDGGMGMASALGYRFLDQDGKALSPVGASLERVVKVDATELRVDFSQIKVTILCDVDNPLYGPRGAAPVYGQQKGGTEQSITRLDQGLQHFAKTLSAVSMAEQPGAGAAGGMGFAGLYFLRGELRSGIDTVLEYADFAQAMARQDYLITGEGRIDAQTLHGKLIAGVCQYARAQQVPVIALCGALDASPQQIIDIGLLSAFAIQPRPVDLATALATTAINLEQTAFAIGKLLQ